MTSPSTVTIGANTYNVYVDQPSCVAYLAASLSVPATTFSAASSQQQAQAMVMAARMFDRQTWAGTQNGGVLAWPRANVADKFGNPISATTIPQDIINGFCELAAMLFSDPALQDQLTSKWNIQSFTSGPTTAQYFHPLDGGRFPMVVQELVGPYLSRSANLGGAYGTDTTGATATDPGDGTGSQFVDVEQYKVTKGI